MPLKWSDAEEIALRLLAEDPHLNPLTIGFADLRDRIMGLSDFDDDPTHANVKNLELIRLAWLEEYQED